MIRLSFTAAVIVFATPAFADHTITVNWHNQTRDRISGSLINCEPRGTCSFPQFGVGVGEIQKTVQTVSPDTFLRWMDVGYSYWHENGGLDGKGGFRGCKISISAHGPSSTWAGPGCEEDKTQYARYFEGIPLNWSCEVKVEKHHETCDFVFDVYMSAQN